MDENESPANGATELAAQLAADRRAALRKLGRYVAISAPAITLMLAAGSKSARAQSCSSCGSSRQFKTPEGGVDTAALLGSARRMPLESGAIQAGDFRATFGLGDGKTIHALDEIGICLGAIQALTHKVERLEAELRKTNQSKAA